MNGKITLDLSHDDEDAVAYVSLPDHPGPGTRAVVRRQVRLLDLVKYAGPDIYLDFDAQERFIGIEILA